jgi:hypothetical protein
MATIVLHMKRNRAASNEDVPTDPLVNPLSFFAFVQYRSGRPLPRESSRQETGQKTCCALCGDAKNECVNREVSQASEKALSVRLHPPHARRKATRPEYNSKEHYAGPSHEGIAFEQSKQSEIKVHVFAVRCGDMNRGNGSWAAEKIGQGARSFLVKHGHRLRFLKIVL